MGMGKLSVVVLVALLAVLAVQASESGNNDLSVSEDQAVEQALLRNVRDAGNRKKKSKSKRRKSLGKKKRKSKRKNKQAKKGGKKKGKSKRKNLKKKSMKKKNNRSRKQKAKKARKARKSMKKKKKGGKKKSGRKQRKNKKKQGKKKSMARQEEESEEDKCIKELAALGGIFGNQARNFYRQASRAQQFADTNAKKLKKKDDFNSTLDAVESVCKGQDAASKEPLAACPGMVEEKCVAANETMLGEVQGCLDDVTAFRDLFIKEIAKAETADAICAIVMAPTTTEMKDKVTACKDTVVDAEAALKADKNACVTAFSVCRKEERN